MARGKLGTFEFNHRFISTEYFIPVDSIHFVAVADKKFERDDKEMISEENGFIIEHDNGHRPPKRLNQAQWSQTDTFLLKFYQSKNHIAKL